LTNIAPGIRVTLDPLEVSQVGLRLRRRQYVEQICVERLPFGRMLNVTALAAFCPFIVGREHPADPYLEFPERCQESQQGVFPIVVLIAKILHFHCRPPTRRRRGGYPEYPNLGLSGFGLLWRASFVLAARFELPISRVL
jgi:hypothetical protein